jgi:N-acetylmuramoyl-L-alanine amidase
MQNSFEAQGASQGFQGFARAILLAATLLLALAGLARAEDLPQVTGSRVAGNDIRTRFVADITRPVSYSVYVLPDPYRVMIDMPEVSFGLPEGAGAKVLGLISEFRFGTLDQGRSRMVLDTDGPVLIEKSYIMKAKGKNPARIVVDLVRTSKETFLKTYRADANIAEGETPLPLAEEKLAEAEEVAPASGAGAPDQSAKMQEGEPPAPPKKKAVARASGRRLIVIDPGHGGIDSGAVSKAKTEEKTVVLDFGLMLRDKLEASGRYDVIMTRDDDTFVTLKERMHIARKSEADLFIAVHADTVRGQSARGATVYTLSEKASDAEAAALAQKENRADIIGGVDLGGENQEITDILIDLAQRETKNHSMFFAKRAVGELKPVTKMTGQPLRSAGFMVLKAPDVPSILIELGYLSSKEDEALLTSEAWQKKIAGALAKAIDGYFANEIAQKE